jgi:hypothetical protein
MPGRRRIHLGRKTLTMWMVEGSGMYLDIPVLIQEDGSGSHDGGHGYGYSMARHREASLTQELVKYYRDR